MGRVIIYLLRTVPFISGITKKSGLPLSCCRWAMNWVAQKVKVIPFFWWERGPAFHQWIGLREKLQETPKFDGEKPWFPVDFSFQCFQLKVRTNTPSLSREGKLAPFERSVHSKGRALVKDKRCTHRSTQTVLPLWSTNFFVQLFRNFNLSVLFWWPIARPNPFTMPFGVQFYWPLGESSRERAWESIVDSEA